MSQRYDHLRSPRRHGRPELKLGSLTGGHDTNLQTKFDFHSLLYREIESNFTSRLGQSLMYVTRVRLGQPTWFPGQGLSWLVHAWSVLSHKGQKPYEVYWVQNTVTKLYLVIVKSK